MQEVEDRRPVKDIVYRFKRAALLEKGKKERRKPVSPAKLRLVISPNDNVAQLS